MSYHLVRCTVCDLVYAPLPPDDHELDALYQAAAFDSSPHADDAAVTYFNELQPIISRLYSKESFLEIGSGTGTLLDYLKNAGFKKLVGVEPSTAAILSAPEHRRHLILQGSFDEGAFRHESFDLICCFMTLEHVRDPSIISNAARRLLRPGGAFVFVTHDRRSIVNRLLGRKSPIIDIEHLQLFSKESARQLLLRSNFRDISIKIIKNRYEVSYWLRLSPLPSNVKRLIEKLFKRMGVSSIRLAINVGNILSVGFK